MQRFEHAREIPVQGVYIPGWLSKYKRIVGNKSKKEIKRHVRP